MNYSTRNEIIDRCPEEFRDELNTFINDIEISVCEIRNIIKIADISEVGRVAEAAKLVEELANKLY